MNKLNESEIKAVRIIEELRSALNANDQTRVDEMRDSLQNLNPTEIRHHIGVKSNSAFCNEIFLWERDLHCVE